MQKTLSELSQKYENGVVYKQPPASVQSPKKLKHLEDDDEEFDKAARRERNRQRKH